MHTRPGATGVELSVIVPIYDAVSTLSPCLEVLVASIGPHDEVIVVDDGSTDGGIAVLDGALSSRVRSLRSDTNIGRGPIRNIGARHATGNVLLFVDADVVVGAGTIEQVRKAFADHPERVALIGSYDDHPAAPNLVSQYRNLLHHHTHHTHGAQASHFWTGLGAVRRDIFDAVGGFDEGRWARDMEDVEFGHRLVDAGHGIDVMPEIQGTHLKRYSVGSMVESDLVHRAIPWSRLILQSHLRSDRFVTSWPQRLSAGSVVAMSAAAFGITCDRRAWAALLAASASFLLVNLSLWRFLTRVRSLPFALASVPLHLLHSGSTVVGFAAALARPHPPRSR